MPVDAVRDGAIDVILRVFEKNAYLDVSLDKTLRRKKLKERGRRFLTHLAYGTVRHRLLSDHILTPLLHQPLEKLPKPILAVLRMGAFQALFCNQVTFPAMVHTSVDLAKKRGHAGTARLVNAVLKRVPQSLDEVTLPDPEREPVRHLSVRYSLPVWLVEQWHADFGADRARAMCEASDVPAA
ncbi:MAG: 16S rRNA (cytosine(967)-C(5))-methyltransferase RsmB, partial [bacterium]|nr:16S rRNA (cytosine(967)-C(5))-methyltransferase RsmB [bacterium]